MELNENLADLAERIEEVGKRRDYKRGGNLNNILEYERLRNIFCDLCLKAFREGKRFSHGE